jgi:HD-like signal output (HDOD) protein/CheY-like chemotaxis protein
VNRPTGTPTPGGALTGAGPKMSLSAVEGRAGTTAALPTKSILFVDDDLDVLGGLRNLLRARRREWEMVFVNSGDEAVALLNTRSFDVVVSDMRMPKMDGATLLQIVKERAPSAIRIILTGQTELDAAMKTVSVAHQFLAKPCQADQLQQVVRRACDLSNLLNSDQLRSLVGGIDRLPSPPQTYVELGALLATPNASLEDVARVIEKDVAMCAKILQLVNSAFFGVPRRIINVLEAATYLGTLMIRNLALSMGAFASFESHDRGIAAASESLRCHSILTAQVARAMFKDKRKAEDAFMAGMLHGIGHLIALTYLDADAAPAVRPAVLGAYLLGLWGIPYPVVEAVAYHDQPDQFDHAEFDLPDAVYLAHSLVGETAPAPDIDPIEPHRIDIEHLQRVGISPVQVAAWRNFTEETIRGRTS